MGVMVAAALGCATALSAAAGAQTLEATRYSPPTNMVDGELVLALPAALTTGLSAGVGASYLRPFGGRGTFALGARASWSTATEYSPVDAVRNDDIRMRICGLVQHVAGRGSFGLRLGLGATAVYESRTREQGSRAGLSGNALETTAWYLFPAADLDGVVFLRVWDAWGMSLSGGPTVHLIDGSARMGWGTSLGVSWQP
jgi:hypothetical protein